MTGGGIPLSYQTGPDSSTRSLSITTGNPCTRRKSVSLVMKSAQLARRAVAAWSASVVLRPVAARSRAASSHRGRSACKKSDLSGVK